jgi:hypothetical protein
MEAFISQDHEKKETTSPYEFRLRDLSSAGEYLVDVFLSLGEKEKHLLIPTVRFHIEEGFKDDRILSHANIDEETLKHMSQACREHVMRFEQVLRQGEEAKD